MSDNSDIDRQNTINDSKNIEFYSQGVAAWFNSALEHDKSLLTLSVAGIGVLVSMVQTSIDSICALLLYSGAIISFMFCLVSVLMIFKRNKKHILNVFSGKTEDDPFLDILDGTASFSFFIAILLSVILGISSAINTYIDKGKKMTNNPSNTHQPMAGDSVNGFGNLKVGNESFNQMSELQKSFQGMAQLQTSATPQASQNTTNQTQSASASASATGNQPNSSKK